MSRSCSSRARSALEITPARLGVKVDWGVGRLLGRFRGPRRRIGPLRGLKRLEVRLLRRGGGSAGAGVDTAALAYQLTLIWCGRSNRAHRDARRVKLRGLKAEIVAGQDGRGFSTARRRPTCWCARARARLDRGALCRASGRDGAAKAVKEDDLHDAG